MKKLTLLAVGTLHLKMEHFFRKMSFTVRKKEKL